jgi:cytoskeleton protein RodZ
MAKVTRLSLDNGGGLDRRRLHLREISDDGDAPLDTVGQDLRKARQRKGEDLAQISAALKIRKGYLDALEQSNLEELPGRVYAIGFVRSYADYLGLDAEQCVERLKIEIAGRDEEKEAKVSISPEQENKLPQGTAIFVIVLLIALVYGVYYLVSASRMQAPPVTPVPARLSAQTETPPPPPAVEPVQTPPAETQAAAVPEPATPPPPPKAADVQLPQGQKLGTGNRNSRVTIRIHRPVHVSVQGASADQFFINRNLNPGDTYAVPNLPGIKLSASDSGALEAIVDGNSLGYMGGDGIVAEALSLNPQDVVNRQSR